GLGHAPKTVVHQAADRHDGVGWKPDIEQTFDLMQPSRRADNCHALADDSDGVPSLGAVLIWDWAKELLQNVLERRRKPGTELAGHGARTNSRLEEHQESGAATRRTDRPQRPGRAGPRDTDR